jgi:hypothetical protein
MADEFEEGDLLDDERPEMIGPHGEIYPSSTDEEEEEVGLYIPRCKI